MSMLKLLIVSLVLSTFISPIFVLPAHASGQEMASSVINQAEDVVASAYEAVLEAERAGANVSGLLARLNQAGEFLAGAWVAFRLGDFEEAARSASLCSEISESVKNEAGEMRVEAYGLRVKGFWLTMTGSLVGVVAVVFGSFVGWRVFKRRYYMRVSRMKPEVSSGES